MLDFFTILTKGGLVLWWYQDQIVHYMAEDFAQRINDLIHTAMLEGKANFSVDSMTLKYKLDNEFDLVFVVGYQTNLKISYADQFLDEIQRRFRDKYENQLVPSLAYSLFSGFERNEMFEDFDQDFECAYGNYRGVKNKKVMKTFNQSYKSKTTIQSMYKKSIQSSNTKPIKTKVQDATNNSEESSSDSGNITSNSQTNSNNQDDEDTDKENEKTFNDGLTVEEIEINKRKKFGVKNKNIHSKFNKTNKQKTGKQKTQWIDVNSFNTAKKNKQVLKDLDFSESKIEDISINKTSTTQKRSIQKLTSF